MATQTIDYNINVNAGGSIRTIEQIEQELNELNNEIKEVGIGSKAFNTAAGNIQKLEKELVKANTAVEGFTIDKKLQAADGAIKLTSGAVTGLVGGLGLLGIQSENFDKLTAQATSAISFGMGLKDISEGYQQIVKSEAAAAIGAKLFGTTTRAALVATGIGALVVALGTIIAYWDEISAAVGGVSQEMSDSLDSQAEMVELSEQQFDAISATENTLRLSGKTEREIRDLKIQQTEETINALEAQLITQEEVKNAQVAASERNRAILQGVIRFVSLPLTLLLGTVDAITAALSYIPGIGDIGTNLEEGFSGGIANLIFDPEEVAAEGDATIAETTKKLAELKNRRDGFKLKEQEENEATRVKNNADSKADSDKKKAEEQELADLKAQIREAEANTVAELRAKELEDKQLEYDALIELAAANNLATFELEASRDEALLALRKQFSDEDIAIAKENEEKNQAILDAKKQAQFAYVGAVGGVINALGGLAEQGTAAAKTAAIADIIINTGLGFAQGLDIAQKSAKATGPAAAFAFPIFYATQIAAVLGAIGKAKSILSQVKGGGSGGGAIAAPNVAQTPSISSANIDLGVSPETQVAGTAVQAYVVSGDITSSQEAEAKLSTRRAIGG